MKVSQKMMMFVAALTLSSAAAFASEGGVGNGGVSVVCRNNAKKIISAQILDIYEGEVRFGKVYDDALDVETRLELVAHRLKDYPVFLKILKDEIEMANQAILFVKDGNTLTPTNDAFPAIVKNGCDLEQLANYTDDPQDLLVSKEIYQNLKTQDKAALLVHEAIYKMFRENGSKDSRLARRLTAELISKNPSESTIATILKDFKPGLDIPAKLTTFKSHPYRGVEGTYFSIYKYQNSQMPDANVTVMNRYSQYTIGYMNCKKLMKGELSCELVTRVRRDSQAVSLIIKADGKNAIMTHANGAVTEYVLDEK